MIGPPQVAAVLILVQRLLEEIYSQRNTRRLLADGAQEAGAEYYPVVAVTHLGWVAALLFLIPPDTQPNWILLGGFLALQVVRYWVIGSLGRYWTHRIITLEGEPTVKSGPYAIIRHPNYAVTLVETFLLPLAFGAWEIAFIMTAVWAAVLRYKIILEDEALAARR